MTHQILVVDDDPIVLKTFKRLLELNGYTPVISSNYDEALRAIREQDIDLVLSDIRMPGKNGVETVSAIQETIREAGKEPLPIIFITGYAEMGDQLNAEFYGEILYKPVDNEKLLIIIREYL